MVKKRTVRIVLLVLISLGGLIFFAVAGLLFLPFKAQLGKYQIENRVIRDPKQFSVWEQGFKETEWDGPTGTYSHGDIYTYKRSDWMWRLDIWTGNPNAGF